MPALSRPQHQVPGIGAVKSWLRSLEPIFWPGIGVLWANERRAAKTHPDEPRIRDADDCHILTTLDEPDVTYVDSRLCSRDQRLPQCGIALAVGPSIG